MGRLLRLAVLLFSRSCLGCQQKLHDGAASVVGGFASRLTPCAGLGVHLGGGGFLIRQFDLAISTVFSWNRLKSFSAHFASGSTSPCLLEPESSSKSTRMYNADSL